MTAIVDLKILLKDMRPNLRVETYVFCTLNSVLSDRVLALDPLMIFKEEEGYSLILEKSVALKAGFKFDGIFKQITLEIHSALEAVGLTAAFSKALKDQNISANVVAGYYHDHIFVPEGQAEAAIIALKNLSASFS